MAITQTTLSLNNQLAWRLVNTKFPPIAIFDDVANADEFQALYAVQQLTNPRLQNELGNLNLLPLAQIPYSIPGCSYACAPFTHVNPDGSRFSDGSYGVLYLADNIATAIAEVHYHQQKLWQNIKGLHYDTIIMRGLQVEFNGLLIDLTTSNNQPIHHPDDYSVARQIGYQLITNKGEGIQYHSVRSPGAVCWALMTPKNVTSVIQTSHFEFVYDGEKITQVRTINTI